MNSKRIYIYNVVLNEKDDVFVQFELLTDKELEKSRKLYHKNLKTVKAKVYAESCYISFGVRYGQIKQFLT